MSDLAVWLLGFATGGEAETKPFLDGLKRIAAKQEELSKDT